MADDACGVEQVSEVYSTSGQYDLLMKCYIDDKTDIGHFVTSQIQTLAGVKDTFTLITFKAFSLPWRTYRRRHGASKGASRP